MYKILQNNTNTGANEYSLCLNDPNRIVTIFNIKYHEFAFILYKKDLSSCKF